MNRRSVWSIIDKKDLPENKKTLGLKWVCNIKSNGVFKERLVDQGFLQDQVLITLTVTHLLFQM